MKKSHVTFVKSNDLFPLYVLKEKEEIMGWRKTGGRVVGWGHNTTIVFVNCIQWQSRPENLFVTEVRINDKLLRIVVDSGAAFVFLKIREK